MDLINILIGAFFSALASFALFFFSNKYNWRNKLFHEFKVYIEIDTKNTKGNKVDKIKLYYQIDNGSDKSQFISYAYFLLPKGYNGRYDPNYTLGEALFGDQKDYEYSLFNIEIEHSKSDHLNLTHPGLIKAINDKKLNELQLFVSTPRYGLVKSNKESIWN